MLGYDVKDTQRNPHDKERKQLNSLQRRSFSFDRNVKTKEYYEMLMVELNFEKKQKILKRLSTVFVKKGEKIASNGRKWETGEGVERDVYNDIILAKNIGFVNFDSIKGFEILPIFHSEKYMTKVIIPFFSESRKKIVIEEIFEEAKRLSLLVEPTAEVLKKVNFALENDGGELITYAVDKKAKLKKQTRVKFYTNDFHRKEVVSDPYLSQEEINFFEKVKKNQAIGELQRIKEGQTGVNIFENIEKENTGGQYQDILGDGLMTKDQRVFSKKDGYLLVGYHGILDVFDNVDVVNGETIENYYNSDASKILIVKGNILKNVRIVTSGDVRVLGRVEKVILISEGDVYVSGGISQGAYVESHGSIMAEFSAHAVLLAANSIYIEKYVLASFSAAVKDLIVYDEASGVVAASHLLAGRKIEATEIGSKNGYSTKLELTNTILNRIRNKKFEFGETTIQRLDALITKLSSWVSMRYIENEEEVLDLPFERQEKYLKTIHLYKGIVKEREVFKKIMGERYWNKKWKGKVSRGDELVLHVKKTVLRSATLFFNDRRYLPKYSKNESMTYKFYPRKNEVIASQNHHPNIAYQS